MPEQTEEQPKKTEKVVVFTERPTIRLIQAEDWEAAGVKDHAPTLWGPSNDWTVAKADLGLNGEQYSRIILADKWFREETREVVED